jgi:large subunit ribosomal protein L10
VLKSEVKQHMPNAKVLSEKQAIVAALTEKLQRAGGGVLVDYKGITVAEDTALRSEMRKNNVEYTVVKNTLLRFAVQNAGLDGLTSVLEGTTALAISDDPVAPAKVVVSFAKKMNGQKFLVKAGFVEGKELDVKGVNALAELPSKEVLVATVLGTMMAPISGLANVLNANIAGLARALQAIADKKAS